MAGKKKTAAIKRAPAPQRKQRGRVDRSAMFPVPPPASDAPPDYAAWLADLKSRIRQERLRVVLASNAVMVLLYWDLGRSILEKQADQGWGSRVIDRLSADLREAFPEMNGFSPRNLKYMRAFAAAWPDRQIVQASLAQLTWYHHIALLEKLDSPERRLWYAARTLEHGWSRNILALQIEAQAHRRQGKAQTNFPAMLPPPESDMATQIFKDPYLFDFLGSDAPLGSTLNRTHRELTDDDLARIVGTYHVWRGDAADTVGRVSPAGRNPTDAVALADIHFDVGLRSANPTYAYSAST